ncbi:MAG: nucleotidyltransferase [Bacteroidetes bacterium CG_4_10_14_3_um_filter_31_20]|nr:nucleotidyltransferase domain-containing protein [Bacteroidota bacterium]PIX32948.1 MAG: nucleotidyltransferase [Bacteroidetes bacterium CG_4_8_14_3_um_filter_31_14]PIY03733.1 MAG: nucleotidyltransferase [Bacteroidetes bacterium CG_4_10_14_3_um_filter_31_20]
MDKKEALRIANEYINSISSKYNIKQAILFGSFAKGTYNDDSDIDIAIVVNNIVDIIDTQIDLMKLRRKIDLRIEPHPFMTGDFNRTNPVVNEIIKYGIEIYNNET